MDFLEIRRKARERAAAGAEAAALPVVATAGGSPAAGRAASAEPPVPRAARRDPPAPSPEPEPVAAPDPRFTTWRPGSGERPSVPAFEPGVLPRAGPSDFTVYDPGRTQAPAPLPAPAPMPELEVERPRAAGQPLPGLRAPEAAWPGLPGHRSKAAPRDPLTAFFYREDEEVPALAALPAEAAPALRAGPEDASIEEYLSFRLGAEEYAVPIEHVREVMRSQAVTEVPRAPGGILGVVTVRGEVVAVFDPRRRLGLPGPLPAVGSGRIVIVDDGQGPHGLLVDAVASVVRLARGSIEPCPQGIGGANADCLAGIGRERSRLFTVLNLQALLRRAPARAGEAHGGA